MANAPVAHASAMVPGPSGNHQRQPAAVTYGKSWADDIQKYHVRITASCVNSLLLSV